jgi:hypothetical protein
LGKITQALGKIDKRLGKIGLALGGKMRQALGKYTSA